MGDSDAPPGGRVLRNQDSGFRVVEKAHPGARCEWAAGRKALEGMGGEGRARYAEMSRKRISVEWFFGRLNKYRWIVGPYAEMYSELNVELNIVGGW